jgi:hypothetical protein
MLRGLPTRQTRADMEAILAEFRRREIPVLVAGMLAAPNLGPQFAAEFNSIYPDVARATAPASIPSSSPTSRASAASTCRTAFIPIFRASSEW